MKVQYFRLFLEDQNVVLSGLMQCLYVAFFFGFAAILSMEKHNF